VGHATLYTAASEVRRFVFNKKRGNQRNSRKMYCPILARWFHGILAADENVGGEILRELLEQTVTIRVPDKSGYITELWHHFDAINDLLLSARRGEDFFSAAKKLDRHKQYFQPIADRDLIQCLKAVRRA
jgi:hypothetical protein